MTEEFGTLSLQQNREPRAAGFSPEYPAQMLAPQPLSGALWVPNFYPLPGEKLI
jgi:hypothetical protein